MERLVHIKNFDKWSREYCAIIAAKGPCAFLLKTLMAKHGLAKIFAKFGIKCYYLWVRKARGVKHYVVFVDKFVARYEANSITQRTYYVDGTQKFCNVDTPKYPYGYIAWYDTRGYITHLTVNNSRGCAENSYTFGITDDNIRASGIWGTFAYNSWEDVEKRFGDPIRRSPAWKCAKKIASAIYQLLPQPIAEEIVPELVYMPE